MHNQEKGRSKSIISNISNKISKECQIQHDSLESIIQLMQNQKCQYNGFEYLCNGAFAIVLRAHNQDKKREVALKIQACSNQENEKDSKLLKKEYKLLQQFNHSDFLISVYDCFFLSKEQQELDENQNAKFVKKNVYFVIEMELCVNNLKQVFTKLRNKNQKLSKEQKEVLAIQMLDALNTLHIHKIVHRDIKPSNFLIFSTENHEYNVKLCDLGLSSTISESNSYLSKKGTDQYFAPEVINGKSRIQSDLYSLGLVLLELDNLNILKENWIDYETKYEIYSGKGIASKNNKIDRESNIYKIAEICLKKDYKQRKSAGELLSYLVELHQSQLKFLLNSLVIEEQVEKQAERMFTRYNNQIKENAINNKFPHSLDLLIKLLKKLYQDQKYKGNFEIIGFGSFGIVFATKQANNLQDIALKIQHIENQQAINNEIQILKKVQMMHVIKLYDYYEIEVMNEANQQIKYMIQELEKCTCSLYDYLERQKINGEISQEDKLTISRQIIDSVNHIHKLNIIHMDIKPANFLINITDDKPIVKLTDFGLSVQLNKGQEFAQVSQLIGTLSFMAPEMYNRDLNKMYSKQSDIFAVGLVLSLLDNYLTLNKEYMNLHTTMMNQKFNQPFQDSQLIKRDSQIYKYIEGFVVYERTQRKSLAEIVSQNQNDYFSNQNKINKIFGNLQMANRENIQAQFRQINMKINPNQMMKRIKLKINIQDLFKNYTSNSKELADIGECQIDLKSKQIDNEGVEILIIYLSEFKSLTTLNLNLSQNFISDQGAKDLGVCLSKLKDLINLRLDLSYNQIGYEGVSYLIENVEKCHNIEILDINFMQNNIEAAGVSCLSFNISKFSSLQNLSLNLKQNRIKNDGAIVLSRLNGVLEIVQTFCINLQNNAIGADGILEITEAIKKSKNLETLSINFSQNLLNNEGASYIGNAISGKFKIVNLKINLKETFIESDGVRYLAKAIGSCKLIQELSLNLSKNKVKDEGVIELASAISHCNKIKYLKLNLQNAMIQQNGSRLLFKSIECLQLEKLFIYFKENQSIQQGATDLGINLSKSTNIKNLEIDLSQCNIQNECINNLAQALGEFKKMENLSLKLNKNPLIKDSSLYKLGINIICCENLKCLNIELQQIGKEGIKGLQQFLVVRYKIENLSIDLMECKIDQDGIEQIAYALEKNNNINQLKLNLSQNNIGDQGIMSIAKKISKKKFTKIELILRSNSISFEGAKSISNVIESNQNMTQLIIDLDNNQIGNEGARYITDQIQKINTITHLELFLGKNGIDGEGAKSISNAIKMNQNIIKLNLGLSHNSINSQGAENIARVLQNNINISELIINLNFNQIDAQGAKSLANSIQKIEKIRKIQFSLSDQNYQDRNKINVEAVRCIACSLEYNKYLTQVYIDMSQISNEGVQLICHALEKNQNILKLSLNLKNNSINQEGAKSIAKALENNENITKLLLDLRYNSINTEGAKYIANSLERLQYLKNLKFYIDGNKIQNEGVISITNSLLKNINIFEIVVQFSQNSFTRLTSQKIMSSFRDCNKRVTCYIDFNLFSAFQFNNLLYNLNQS